MLLKSKSSIIWWSSIFRWTSNKLKK